jgi:hypothetical protein
MRLRFLAPLIVLLAACQKTDDLLIEPAEVWVAAEVRPVRRDPATGEAAVPLRVLNDRPYTVYVAACGERPSVEIERRAGDAWVNAGAAVCPAIYSAVPLEVEGRSSTPFTVSIREPGVYRVVASVSVAADRSDFRAVASSEFRVE